jgi:hypothetical protein
MSAGGRGAHSGHRWWANPSAARRGLLERQSGVRPHQAERQREAPVPRERPRIRPHERTLRAVVGSRAEGARQVAWELTLAEARQELTRCLAWGGMWRPAAKTCPTECPAGQRWRFPGNTAPMSQRELRGSGLGSATAVPSVSSPRVLASRAHLFLLNPAPLRGPREIAV